MLSLFSDRLLVNVDKIDEQHKKLFQIVEEFHTVCVNRNHTDKIVELYSFLKNYTEKHFQDEEEFMLKYSYPEYENHKEQHTLFLRKVYALDSTIKAQSIPLTKVMEINQFFTEGFITHFSETDSKLGEFLKDKL